MKLPFARSGQRLRGVVLLALLIALALLSIGMMSAVDVWSLSRQREREQELLFVGSQYRQAIRHYYLAAPSGGQRGYPTSVAVLLDDDRFPIPVHHLRRAYPDPITGNPQWGELRVGDRIQGVYSLSEARPLKQAGFPANEQAFNDADSYKSWIFAYIPRRAVAIGPPASGAPPSAPPRPSPTPNRRNPS